MIKKISPLNELFVDIKSDKLSNSSTDQRYPVRLIFVNTFSSFLSIVKELNKTVTLTELSNFLPHDDGWLSPDSLIDLFQKTNKSKIIVPLSEILRFFPSDEFKSFFISLFEIENPTLCTDKRIYIPLLGTFERFQKEFLNNFHRKFHWSTIWILNEKVEERITIFQINSNIKTKYRVISTTSDWLNLWKRERIQPLLSNSKSLGFLYKNFLPDFIFQMEEINNHKEYLQKILNFNMPYEFYDKEGEYWFHLRQDIELKSKEGYASDFKEFICNHFNIQNIIKIESIKVLKMYVDSQSKYDKWLLKNFILNSPEFQHSYILLVLKYVTQFSVEELIELIWFKIFSENNFSISYCNERKKLLKYIHNILLFSFSNIENKIRLKLSKIEDLKLVDQQLYLTNITISERSHIINQLNKIDDLTMSLPIVNDIYPELYNYLNWNYLIESKEGKRSWIIEYFYEYNLSKCLDKPTEKLLKIINKKNQNEKSFYSWYYSIDSLQDLNESIIIWIDALGAEWFPLFKYFIELYSKDNNKLITEEKIVKVNLPSTTDNNYFMDANHIMALDEYIHNEKPYKHPLSLIEQIDIINKVVKDIILKQSEKTISIVSDHGFTFLAQKKYGNFKKFNYSGSEHEGRCMWIEDKFKSDSRFLVHKVEKGKNKDKNCLISLRHTSLFKTPFREVHGGATPEEVLVPYLKISTLPVIIEYKTNLISKEISINDPILKLKIKPNPINIPAILINNKKCNLKKENNIWEVKLSDFVPGKYKMELIIDNKITILKFTISGGLQEEDLF